MFIKIDKKKLFALEKWAVVSCSNLFMVNFGWSDTHWHWWYLCLFDIWFGFSLILVKMSSLIICPNVRGLEGNNELLKTYSNVWIPTYFISFTNSFFFLAALTFLDVDWSIRSRSVHKGYLLVHRAWTILYFPKKQETDRKWKVYFWYWLWLRSSPLYTVFNHRIKTVIWFFHSYQHNFMYFVYFLQLSLFMFDQDSSLWIVACPLMNPLILIQIVD